MQSNKLRVVSNQVTERVQETKRYAAEAVKRYQRPCEHEPVVLRYVKCFPVRRTELSDADRVVYDGWSTRPTLSGLLTKAVRRKFKE